jgi:mono/diheme cytochrome c family protein
MTEKKRNLIPIIIASIAIVTILGIAAIYLLDQNQKGPNSSPLPASSSPNTQTNGAQLYAQNCERCHDPLASSQRRGRTVAQIQAAIASVPQMRSQTNLANLTPAQIQAISDALASP